MAVFWSLDVKDFIGYLPNFWCCKLCKKYMACSALVNYFGNVLEHPHQVMPPMILFIFRQHVRFLMQGESGLEPKNCWTENRWIHSLNLSKIVQSFALNCQDSDYVYFYRYFSLTLAAFIFWHWQMMKYISTCICISVLGVKLDRDLDSSVGSGHASINYLTSLNFGINRVLFKVNLHDSLFTEMQFEYNSFIINI